MKESKKFNELNKGDFLYKIYKNSLGDRRILQSNIIRLTRRLVDDVKLVMSLDLSTYYPGIGIKYEELNIDQKDFELTHTKVLFTDIYTAHRHLHENW